MSRNHLNVRMITEGAILIAAALVLGLWKFFELPQGGSINLEMLPILIFVIRWGFPNSLVACTAFGILSVFVQDAIGYGWVSILLDYVVASAAMSVGGLFRGKLYPAAITAVFCRFVVHFVSGITVYRILVPTELFNMTFTNPWIYSLAYNGSYILIDLVLSLIILTALMASPLKKYLKGEDLAQKA